MRLARERARNDQPAANHDGDTAKNRENTVAAIGSRLCANNERYCAMQGWSSVNVRLDPYSAQVQEQSSGHEKLMRAILTIARGDPNYKLKLNGNGDGSGPSEPAPDPPSEPTSGT